VSSRALVERLFCRPSSPTDHEPRLIVSEGRHRIGRATAARGCLTRRILARLASLGSACPHHRRGRVLRHAPQSAPGQPRWNSPSTANTRRATKISPHRLEKPWAAPTATTSSASRDEDLRCTPFSWLDASASMGYRRRGRVQAGLRRLFGGRAGPIWVGPAGRCRRAAALRRECAQASCRPRPGRDKSASLPACLEAGPSLRARTDCGARSWPPGRAQSTKRSLIIVMSDLLDSEPDDPATKCAAPCPDACASCAAARTRRGAIPTCSIPTRLSCPFDDFDLL